MRAGKGRGKEVGEEGEKEGFFVCSLGFFTGWVHVHVHVHVGGRKKRGEERKKREEERKKRGEERKRRREEKKGEEIRREERSIHLSIRKYTYDSYIHTYHSIFSHIIIVFFCSVLFRFTSSLNKNRHVYTL